jgi:hypothetical protein
MGGFFCLNPGYANPFACKILSAPAKKPDAASAGFKYKGYAIIGTKRYALVQIGQTDFEVLEGSIVQGFRIEKVSETRLDYQVNNQMLSILMDSE